MHRADRLSRNLNDYIMIKAALARGGVRIKSVKEDFDDSAAGRFLENVIASAAQFENEVRSARTTDAMKTGLLAGRWMWGAPVGYQNPPKLADPAWSSTPKPRPTFAWPLNSMP